MCQKFYEQEKGFAEEIKENNHKALTLRKEKNQNSGNCCTGENPKGGKDAHKKEKNESLENKKAFLENSTASITQEK